jgi:hypothetical protein
MQFSFRAPFAVSIPKQFGVQVLRENTGYLLGYWCKTKSWHLINYWRGSGHAILCAAYVKKVEETTGHLCLQCVYARTGAVGYDFRLD